VAEIRFDDKVAIVTGAGRGIGREHALLLASRGAAVVVNDPGVELDGSSPDGGPAKSVVEEIQAAGGRAITNTASVATLAGASDIVAAAVDEFGRLDILVNNAGVQIVRPFTETTPESQQLHLDVHLTGTWRVTQAAWPHLVAAGQGRIVNTTSTATLGLPGWSAYGAAKAGIIGLTRTLAVEGHAAGIGVNAVSPGTATRMATDGQQHLQDVRINWAPRVTTPASVAAVAAFLSHVSCPATGEVFYVGRGRLSRIVFAETEGFERDEFDLEAVAEVFDGVMSAPVREILPDHIAWFERP